MDNGFYLELVDGPIVRNEKEVIGWTEKCGDTQNNLMLVQVSGADGSNWLEGGLIGLIRTSLHELGHTGGLLHPFDYADDSDMWKAIEDDYIDKGLFDNLMFTDRMLEELDSDPNSAFNLIEEQLKAIDTEVEQDTNDDN